MMISVSSSRRASLLLAFLSLGVTLAVRGATATGYPSSGNCGKLFECPSYTVLFSNRQLEIRAYDVAEWMSVRYYSRGDSFAYMATVRYNILDAYFHGLNNQDKQIPMTRPVLVEVENSTMGALLYLPKEYQTKAPPLTDPYDKQIMKPGKFPKYKYAAVRRVSIELSSITEEAVQQELGFLKNGLKSTVYKRAAATLDRYTLATYTKANKPSNFTFNEIILWFD